MLPQNKPDRIRILFDDHRLVANAGLLLPATLARHVGLRELVDHHLDLGGAPGRANTGDKMLTLVASALAGGDCIDDADALRATVLEYFTDRKGLLRSFRPSTESQGAKGAGTQTKAVGVDPRRKAPVEHAADNETAPERPSLGRRTYLVDGNSGEAAYKEQESGRIVASAERSEGFHEEPRQEPAQDLAEGKFAEAELRQVEAVAITMGIPTLRAKGNIEVKGVGAKFSGVYYCHAVRHVIGEGGHGTTNIVSGSLDTQTEGRPNARVGDAVDCGARIITGSPNTYVN